MERKLQAFSLVELIIFIIIIGIAVLILLPLIVTLTSARNVDMQTQANELAQKRMDIILEQKNTKSFLTFTDPCKAPQPSPAPETAVCTNNAGFTLNSTITNNWNGDSNYKVITVTVSKNSRTYISLTDLVADY